MKEKLKPVVEELLRTGKFGEKIVVGLTIDEDRVDTEIKTEFFSFRGKEGSQIPSEIDQREIAESACKAIRGFLASELFEGKRLKDDTEYEIVLQISNINSDSEWRAFATQFDWFSKYEK